MKLLTPKTRKPSRAASHHDRRGAAPGAIHLTDDPGRKSGEASEGGAETGGLPDTVRRNLSGDSARYLDSVRLESNGE